MGDRAEGFDVVHHGRPAEIAGLHRERRADARRAALAFQRFDQRRFLAADIGAGAQVDGDVETEAGDAARISAEQALRAAAREHAFELRQQVAVLAAQVEKALLRADCTRRHRHAVEHGVGVTGQQHAVLEGAGLALVGVADDDAQVASGVATGLPFARSRETGTAAAAQAGLCHCVEQGLRRLREHRRQRPCVGG